MDHIGIDLGSRDSQVCVRDSAGAIIEEARRPTTALGRWLASRAPARVVLETCTEAFRLAGVAQRHGHEVRVVAATLVRALGVGQRGLKNVEIITVRPRRVRLLRVAPRMRHVARSTPPR